MQDAFSKYTNSSEVLKALDARNLGLTMSCFTAAVTILASRWKKKSFLRVQLIPAGGECVWHDGLLWDKVLDGSIHTIEESIEKISTMEITGKKPWRLPSPKELVSFSWNNACPWRAGINGRLLNVASFVTSSGCLDLDFNDEKVRGKSGNILAVTESFQDMAELICHAYTNNWCVFAGDDTSNTDLLTPLKTCTGIELNPAYRTVDTHSAKLPPLELADLTDPNKGLWEFWGLDAKGLEAFGLRARNPADDVQQGMVAIDFGTSSTVVAYEQNGVGQLLRIGVTDFWETPKPAHYENPTVLEMVDFEAMLQPWRSEAYRPSVAWDDVRCSHEALQNFRNNDTKPEVVASVLTKIKQWALREGDGTRIRLTDQANRIEHELAPLTLRQPVKGRPLEVSGSDPFDPVELYAWFLGLTINWRRRGIFLRYYMTFPVDYPRQVKDKILASFRRGLQRSLPTTLVMQPVFGQFSVEERASEPAAYAAIALQYINIDPTPNGVAYAVFDFGGGTTDFDFGYYRLPTDTEERAGVERVFEHFGNGGDKFLGGENLLEHLAYLTFLHNLEVCRTQKIAFTKPLDALDFNGSEMFLERTQAAATNALMLVSRLRPFWESGEDTNKTGVEKINLLDRDGKPVPCEFNVPYPELRAFLQNRIEQGLHNFFTALKRAFGKELPAQVQVLLAGNASRSAIVLGLFGLLPEDHELAALRERIIALKSTLFDGHCPEFTAHAPLAADENNINSPTGKTGVALGLLELCPGSSSRVINHSVQNVTGDAPFQHYVGRIRQKKFHVNLPQGGTYNKWAELGPVSDDRVFKLFHSQAARALSGTMAPGDPALILRTLEFAGDTSGHLTFARPIRPHEIEVCSATSLEAADHGEFENLQVLKLI
jgi:hypothetical protein